MTGGSPISGNLQKIAMLPHNYLVGGEWLPWILFSHSYWVANHPNWLSYFSEGLPWIWHEFPWILGCCHHPNWRTPWFFRGVAKNHQPVVVMKWVIPSLRLAPVIDIWGFPARKMGVPKNMDGFCGKSHRNKWMMTGGSSIYGKHHMEWTSMTNYMD